MIDHVFDGSFASVEDVASEFKIPDDERDQLREAKMLFAQYDSEPYQGNAFVVFALGDQLYEAGGSHCSCSGLEGQWEPEANDAAALLARADVPEAAKELIRRWLARRAS